MIRKNKKRIDPRYFLHETATRDLNEVFGEGPFKVYEIDKKGDKPKLVPDSGGKNRDTLEAAKHAAEQQRGRYEVYILDKDRKRVYTKKTGAN